MQAEVVGAVWADEWADECRDIIVSQIVAGVVQRAAATGRVVGGWAGYGREAWHAAWGFVGGAGGALTFGRPRRRCGSQRVYFGGRQGVALLCAAVHVL